MSENSLSGKRIIFYGTPDFAVPTLDALIASGAEVVTVVTQPDKPAGRGKKLRSSPVKEKALEHGIPILQPGRIKREVEDFIERLKELEPIDLGIVIAFGQILPTSVLDFPKADSVNVHGSLLPRWRGAAPIQRAILSGDKKTGICLMKMTAGLDEGPVYSREEIEIGADDNLQSIHDKLATLGAEMIVRDCGQVISGELTSTPQSAEGVTYAEKIQKSEGLINWEASAEEIDRQIRAFAPFPGAFTFLDNKRLKIFEGSVIEDGNNTSDDLPGTVIGATENWIDIKCGQESLRVSQVQLEGKQRLSVKEFLRGAPIEVGDIVGSDE